MRLILAAMAMVLGSTAFGFTADGTLRGGGMWVDANGERDRWTETVTFSRNESGAMVMTSEVTVKMGEQERTMRSVMTFVRRGERSNFFDVTSDDGMTGTGYCFRARSPRRDRDRDMDRDRDRDRRRGAKVCHMGGTTADGSTWEETMHISRFGIRKMGSHFATGPEGEGHEVAYRGRLGRRHGRR